MNGRFKILQKKTAHIKENNVEMGEVLSHIFERENDDFLNRKKCVLFTVGKILSKI